MTLWYNVMSKYMWFFVVPYMLGHNIMPYCLYFCNWLFGDGAL